MSLITDLPTRYDPGPIENKWYQQWLDKNAFEADSSSDRKPYTIVIPPPNVTGALHMGHALNNTLQDILIRWRRMQGFEALWMPGTDHAGIATQSVVEKIIYKTEKKKRHDIGREKLLARIWDWKEEYGERILHQLRKIGSSCDWSRTRFTMDEGLSHAVRKIFVKLYNDGLIYRGRYLVNWCPTLRTALADDEVEPKEVQSHLWHFQYPLTEDPSRKITVATTRPETMLGDTGVAVHPDDERYKDIIGKTVTLPLMEREIPIVADKHVEMDFGTGAVKVTPAHDPNDFEIGERHNLEKINLLNEDGTYNENAGRFEGLDRFDVRKAVVEALDKLGLLEKIEDHTHNVGHCYRTGDVIEPYLSLQWFVKMRPLADMAIKATEDGRVKFHPDRWTNFYLSWLKDVRDWCISRQIWWGHRIPIWYAPDGTPFAGADEAEARAEAEKQFGEGVELNQDEDVLDTWFSSGLWPFSTLGWPDETQDLEKFFPTNTLVTDRGIIFFWVARMVMLSEYALGKQPFSDVYIHGTIMDKEGRKMSKSLKNGIDPVALIDGGKDENTGIVYEQPLGADAVRFSLTTLSMEGQDLKLWPERFEDGSRFLNKVWNAGRFALMQLEGGPIDTAENLDESKLQFEDRWILSRLAQAIEESTNALEDFHYCTASQIVRDFVWNDFCDWYLELVKFRLRDAEAGDAEICRRILARVFDTTLRLLHPICPFITEELWNLLGKVLPQRDSGPLKGELSELILESAWPSETPDLKDPQTESTFDKLKETIQVVRKLRQERNLAPKATKDLQISATAETVQKELEPHLEILKNLGNLDNVQLGVDLDRPDNSATEVLKEFEVSLPVPEGDRSKEIEAAKKQKEELESYIQRESKKLENPSFVERAPAQVVEGTKKRVEDAKNQLQAVLAILKSLE